MIDLYVLLFRSHAYSFGTSNQLRSWGGGAVQVDKYSAGGELACEEAVVWKGRGRGRCESHEDSGDHGSFLRGISGDGPRITNTRDSELYTTGSIIWTRGLWLHAMEQCHPLLMEIFRLVQVISDQSPGLISRRISMRLQGR